MDVHHQSVQRNGGRWRRHRPRHFCGSAWRILRVEATQAYSRMGRTLLELARMRHLGLPWGRVLDSQMVWGGSEASASASTGTER